MTDILVTGFAPFDGRSVNASWIAAASLDGVHKLEIPVVWGEPMKLLGQVIETIEPRCIISMGEGRDGWFDIETRARNARKHRLDNTNSYPTGEILPGNASFYPSTADFNSLHQQLADQGIPIRVSQDAGQFLCEETLYCLEHFKQQVDSLELVTFVHLPPFGSELQYLHQNRTCDKELLSDFANRLLNCVKAQLTQVESKEFSHNPSLHQENHG